jgi:zinc transporter ZupT
VPHTVPNANSCFCRSLFPLQLLNYLVTLFLGGHHHHNHAHDDDGDDKKKTSPISTEEDNTPPQDQSDSDPDKKSALDQAAADAVCPCHAEDPAGNLDKIQNMAESILQREQQQQQISPARPTTTPDWGNVDLSDDGSAPARFPTEDDDDQEDQLTTATGAERKKEEKLMSMSIKTALAIGLHNFPEGLATFVAAVGDPQVGAVLAVAIAIHNIPEGLCVAMPIYYATGNKMKAFGWAMFSGLSEPLAAVLGWAVLANSFSENMYGSMFGMVAGMMVIISARELLPTAHRYDPDDSVVTYSFIGGMAIMALSLMLFLL